LFFYLSNCLEFKNIEMWHHGQRVNMIDMIVLTTRYYFFHEARPKRTKKLKVSERE
jgi:hypothetical protein